MNEINEWKKLEKKIKEWNKGMKETWKKIKEWNKGMKENWRENKWMKLMNERNLKRK